MFGKSEKRIREFEKRIREFEKEIVNLRATVREYRDLLFNLDSVQNEMLGHLKLKREYVHGYYHFVKTDNAE